MRYNRTRKALIFWCLFIGVGAVAGAAAMIIDPSGKTLGMDGMLPFFQILPFADVLFRDFLFPGFALLIVNGITNLTAAVLLIKNKKLGIILGGIFGVTLMLWIVIQFIMFPLNFMSTAYFIFGLIQAVTGYMCYVFYKQESFCINNTEYANIGSNPDEIVVYFSRMGYTKKIALEAADRSGAEILEIKSSEKTSGTTGFWWCGRCGLHGWEMPILPPEKPLERYKKVTLVSPIWVFGLCGPMKALCKQYSGRLKNVDYILTHFMKASFNNVANQIDLMLDTHRQNFSSICVRFGEKIK